MDRSKLEEASPPRRSALSALSLRLTNFLLGPEAPQSHPTVLPTPAPAKRTRVMVVDDNPDHRMAIHELLTNRGITPMLAADGAEAVALAGDHQLDIILMDLQMPVLDGLAACREIRRGELERGRFRVPVLAYTSMPAPASLLRQCGLDAVLEKPCSAGALDACLARWCP
jgi:CheY-like chemotaxis protein